MEHRASRSTKFRALNISSEELYFLLVAAVAGALDVWLIIGWREIDPRNLSWLSGDSAASEIGWEFMRTDTVLRIPPTWIARLNYPNGASASYFDFIPLIGTPLRFVSAWLPTDFQYIGLFAVACFALQAFFGIKLAAKACKDDPVITVIGGAFFLLAPVLTKELYGHFALLSQWLVLASLYFYLRVSPERTATANLAPFAVLCAVASAIHPYFSLMTIAVGAAAIARAHAFVGRAAISASWVCLLIGATVLSLTIFGFIVPGRPSFLGTGYTHYAMNLLAPINPQSPYSLFIKGFPVVHGWTLAGYEYLGLGTLLLLLISLARQPTLLRRIWSPPVAPLAIASVLLTLLALSTEVTLGEHVLFNIPAPDSVFAALSTFRASGRLFWPVYYLLILGALAAIVEAVPSAGVRRAVLAAALAIQFFDVLPVAQGVAHVALATHPNPLHAGDWTTAARRRHLVILPALQCAADSPGGLDAWPHFARLAARNGMTLNSVYMSRISVRARVEDCVRTPSDMLHNGFRPDTAYVLNDRLTVAMEGRPTFFHDCRRVDGFNLCLHPPKP